MPACLPRNRPRRSLSRQQSRGRLTRAPHGLVGYKESKKKMKHGIQPIPLYPYDFPCPLSPAYHTSANMRTNATTMPAYSANEGKRYRATVDIRKYASSTTVMITAVTTSVLPTFLNKSIYLSVLKFETSNPVKSWHRGKRSLAIAEATSP